MKARAFVCGTLLSILTALAAAHPVPAQDTSQSQPANRRDFNIPAQPLTSALAAFGQQSGLQITTDGDLVRGLSTRGVQGLLTAEEALRQLLAGTGLGYTIGAAGTIVLRRPPQAGQLAPGVQQLDPVQVQGNPVPSQAMIDNLPPPYAGGQVATGGQLGMLGNRSVMDTPFNQSNYTAKKAQDQQAKTVRDVLIDDPSVRQSLPDGSAGSDQFYIRGFDAGGAGGYAYGGLFGILPSFSIMTELAERIEVLKGPSVLLSGMPPNGVIGGMVNVIPKRAPDADLTQLTANYVSAGQFGGHADIARRFGDDKQFGVRFNGVFKAGQTEVVGNSDQRSLGVLGLDFRGENVRLAADLGYQHRYIGGVVGYLGVANGVPLPWAPDARLNQGQPWSYNQLKDLFGVVRAEVDMTERITAYASFGLHDFRFDGVYTAGVTATDVFGNATAFAPNSFNQYATYLTGEAGIRALVDTGPIGHEVSIAGSTYESTSGDGTVTGPAFATNIYNPTIVARPNLPLASANKTSTSGLMSLAIADTLSAADKRIQLTAGLRLQNVTAANFNGTTGQQTSSYDQSAVSPAVALVFRPWENVTVYGNWIQGLQRGTIVPNNFANAGEIFPPFMSTQYEAGVKVDWGSFTTTASAFQITRPSILTNVATNTQFLGGQQRNQGLELNVFGEPVAGVRLLGGIMLLNAVLTQTQGGLTDGWVAPFSPGFNLNLAGEWDLPFVPGLALNGRLIYTGSQYIDTTFPRRSLPEWTRFDLGVRYAFENPGAKGKLLVARFNVENLLDADYWQSGRASTVLFLGSPRTFRLALTADF